MRDAANEFLETRVPARLDRLPWGRFHTLVAVALGITWMLDGLEVPCRIDRGALEASPRLHFSASDIGLASSFYLAGAVIGALGLERMSHRAQMSWPGLTRSRPATTTRVANKGLV